MTKKMKRGRHASDEMDLFSGASSRRDHIKEAQLCAQVARTLSYSLAELPHDDLLDLFLIEVVPAPDASRLAVRLEAPPDADVEALQVRLRASLGRIRSDVASAIHRKKVPTLVFEIFPMGGPDVG